MGSRLLAARHALISLVLVGSLAACGDDAEVAATTAPEPTSPMATAESPDPTSSPTALATAVPLPVMPPEMANNDAAGAEAALRYVFELYGYTYVSQDLAPWQAIADDDCVFCNSVLEGVEEHVADSLTQAGGLLKPLVLSLAEHSEDQAAYVFEGSVTQSPYEIRTEDGSIVESGGESVTEGTFIIAFRGDSWRLIAAGSSAEGE